MEPSGAPGWPGSPPRWTSSAKAGIGTALGPGGRLWFTLSHGILNEVYYPRVDQPCIRDLGLIITDGGGFFSEEKRHTRQEIDGFKDGVPAFRLSNTCLQGRYRVEKDVVADPQREVVLQRVRFTALKGAAGDYRLHALLAPHLGNRGGANNAWVGEYKGAPMLFAECEGIALALACSTGWTAESAGFVGVSDGWQDLRRHGRMEWRHGWAHQGNVALTGEIGAPGTDGEFVLALGFGRSGNEAAHRAAESLRDGFEAASTHYRRSWEHWQSSLRLPAALPPAVLGLCKASATVLRSHESSHFPGGVIASLSIPWGFSKGDGDLGGYHLVWPRDLVESAGGLLAIGAIGDVKRVLSFLAVTQEADGHWPQNMWLDGTPYWSGVQMDETGFPILLVDLVCRHGNLSAAEQKALWGMVRRAAAYLVQNGPVTQQDRWEEDAGFSPFTLAVEVAALLCAADIAAIHEPALAGYLRETADAWNAAIERWTYVRGTELARQQGVDGYYVRISPSDPGSALPAEAWVPIKNRPAEQGYQPASQVVSPDALALVRFGLRAPDDPRILGTVKVIDALLKVELPAGPLWRRYNGDGYGEHADGSAFDGTGIGRPWPLLSAERAHYELAAGRAGAAKALRDAMPSFASQGCLLPEQTWDAPDIARRELVLGGPSGSAMPLAWAHAEYLKLCRSIADGAVFDMPRQAVERYQVRRTGSKLTPWRFNLKARSLEAGQDLRIELLDPARVR
ncbi:MAG TPA: glucan 1,4-alpha-glucosidase, partial [bacterium]|nr:glucan 1,4-alpha-glucosidase [bacterium]